jgi:outer membrane protein TolC
MRPGSDIKARRSHSVLIVDDVENAISALVKREVQVGILTQGESSFARARENSNAVYRGVVRLIEELDADSNLLQVRDAKAQAQTEAARAAIASFRALGGGWDCVTGKCPLPPPPLDE